MAIFRETSAVGAEKCSHNVNIIAICKVGTSTEVGSGGRGVFAQGPSTPSEREGETRNAGSDMANVVGLSCLQCSQEYHSP